MQVSVKKISNVLCELTVVLPPNTVEEVYQQKMNYYVKNSNIKGFRPGKAPISVIQQHFGQNARSQALQEVIENTVKNAITESKLIPINQPRVESKKPESEKSLELTISFEIFPEVESIKFEIPQVERFKVDITEQDVKHVVEQLLKNYAKWNPVTRGAQLKDRLVVDYYPIFEGKEVIEEKNENFNVELGSKTMIPGFEEGLIGSKPGDKVTLNLHFPDNYQIAEMAGKPATFVVEVKEIYEGEMPEFNEEFIKKVGIESGKEEDFYTQIRKTLEFERDRIIRENLKNHIFSKLLDQNPIEVPQSLIEREAKIIHDQVFPEGYGKHEHSEEEMTSFNEVAKKRVALGILVSEYAKQHQLKVEEEDMIKRITEIATAYENPEKVMKWLSSDRRGNIEAQLLEDVVLNKLLDGKEIIEKSISYDELKNYRT
jgi:trigger factor